MDKDQLQEAGNAFIFVLLGVVLLAALAYTFSRGTSSSSNNMTKQKATVSASEIIEYSSLVERTVQKMRRRPMSENDFSFTYAPIFFYAHTPVQPDENKVFNSAGGNIPYIKPTVAMLDSSYSGSGGYQDWLFWTKIAVTNIGTTGVEDLLMGLLYVDKDVCKAINNKLGITNPGGLPPVEIVDSPTHFLGTHNSAGPAPIGDEAGNALDGQTMGCFNNTSYNVFYNVLQAR